MSTKPKSNGIAEENSTTTPKNGKYSSDEHLEKANKAMGEAWSLISQRKSSTNYI